MIEKMNCIVNERDPALDVFKTKKDKLIKTILKRIIFLDTCFYKAQSAKERDNVKVALAGLENLLKMQRYLKSNLSDIDYDNMKKFIDQTILKVIDLEH